MRAGIWVRSHRDRPVTGRERRAAMRTVTLLLTTATIAVILTRPAPTTPPGTNRSARAAGQPSATAAPGALSAAMQSTVDGFLAGYLPYLYGRGAASHIKDATAAFTRTLEAHPPRVPPGLRALEPRVLRLLPTPAGQFSVTAIISDEPTVEYRVTLRLTRSPGRLLISGLDAG